MAEVYDNYSIDQLGCSYITWLASAGTLGRSLARSLSLSRNSLFSVYDAVVLIFKSAFIE